MSKQDRQGVRTPADIERKYNLGGMSEESKQQSEMLGKLVQTIAQLEATTNAKIAELEAKYTAFYPVGSVYVSVNDAEPATVFGGEWELTGEGYLLIGLDQESEDTPAELQYLDRCYIWRRTA